MLMARQVIPRRLAAFSQGARVPALGQTARHAKQTLWPRNAPVLWSPACCVRYFSDMRKEDEVLPLSLQKSFNKIVRDEKFASHTVEARVVPPDGGSFMGLLREFRISGPTDNGFKQIDLFVKTMLPGTELTIYSVPGAYKKETTVYGNVLKMLNELQDEARIPIEDRYNVPKTYTGVDSENIIMENLAKKGYSMCERMQVMPLRFAELAVQQMARLHGMTFVMQAKRPEFFETMVKTLNQPFYYNTPDWNMFVGNVSKMALTVLDPEAKKKVAAYLPTTFEKYSKYAEDANSVRTIVHGDFRANNAMMKVNNGDITEVLLLDFQQTFYGCPIIDFFYFIFSGTDQEFRRQHMEALKTLYHDSMRKYLKHFDLDVDSYYSKNEFERLYKEKLDYGLMISLWLVPIVLADKGEVPDVTKVDLNEVNFKINDTVKNRVRGAVDDFIKWGYL